MFDLWPDPYLEKLYAQCANLATLQTPKAPKPYLVSENRGVNDRLLDHCQASSVPHYCGFKEQEIPISYTVWIVIY